MDEQSRELLDRVRAVVEERDALRARLEEREADMHARIRAGYDRTVADSWRAKVAQVEAERDALRTLVDAAGSVISEVGCECACDHSTEDDHDDDCDLCSVCRIAKGFV